MENFNFWFWDMTIDNVTRWNRACWHVKFRLPSHAHAEALAAQLSRDALPGLGTRVEVSDSKGMACRWIDGKRANTTSHEWKPDHGQGYMLDDVKTNGFK
jgi:hypothetical protein